MKHSERLIVVALACALLAACGGGDDNPAPPPVPLPTDAVPPSASESSAGLVKYLAALIASSADDKEPADLSTFAPKTPDDTEPEPLS